MVVQNKRILLVLFFLLCFISIHARARKLKEKSNTVSSGDSSTTHKETHDNVFKPKEGKDNGNEVFSMDYTPARRKPPIHNLN
ncbi:uncharacterized protein LOC109799451 [Cajanus cajan]|uniref:Root meristem growth factor 9 n=1 Tax=Cajanus cajan TaxID=3821 RepID=A0A151TL87_CAJCA|nr:uncharacterized protein LOC109799451 [Cajanus cajan]KYP67808.1 hypothetical protein KK1_024161 [Cajanus cajan]